MARLLRIAPVGVPVHVIQRGNNRQVCFVADEDYAAYIDWLRKYSRKFGVDVHAWVMMTNHVHLLCSPQREQAISKMMQALGRHYVRYFNFEYRRTGTLWEGRYKSCLVQADSYLLKVYRYIELNPVRAEMVQSPGEYQWSSYHINGLGNVSDLCTPHPEYLALGAEKEERLSNYRGLFAHHIDRGFLDQVRSNINKNLALGTDRFKEEIELLTGRRLRPKKRGRPKEWRKPDN